MIKALHKRIEALENQQKPKYVTTFKDLADLYANQDKDPEYLRLYDEQEPTDRTGWNCLNGKLIGIKKPVQPRKIDRLNEQTVVRYSPRINSANKP